MLGAGVEIVKPFRLVRILVVLSLSLTLGALVASQGTATAAGRRVVHHGHAVDKRNAVSKRHVVQYERPVRHTKRHKGHKNTGSDPSVTSVSPSTGPFYGGTTVTITGIGFDSTPGKTTFALGTNPDTFRPNSFANVSCSSSTTCTAQTPFASKGPATGTLDVIATVDGTPTTANPSGDHFTYGSTITTGSKNVAYVTDFGTGLNDTEYYSLFKDAVGNPSWGGVSPGTGNTGTFAGVNFTSVPVSNIDAAPTTALKGFDTVVLYEVCDIGSHPKTLSAINDFLTAGGKVMIYDSDACHGTYLGSNPSGSADYSGFLFPFTTSSPGPLGDSGSYSVIQASSLTAGLTVGLQPYDAVGDANIFTTFNGSWCGSITATNALDTTGYVQAYAETGAGGLAIYNGEDNFDTDSPSNHLAQVFSLSLAQTFAPITGLPCTVNASGITLSPSSATDSAGGSQTVTATVDDADGSPVNGVTVNFKVTSGPDSGKTGVGVTGFTGHTTFTYSDSGGPGVDDVQASFVDSSGTTRTSNLAAITWLGAPPPPTTLTTSLSGGGKTGTTILVPPSTSVTDAGAVTGTNAAIATGSVTYDVYSNSGCTTAVSIGTAKTITTPGSLPASSPVTLTATGRYYWQASYSGDTKNAASKSTCGTTGEVETVGITPPPPTSVTTSLSGGGQSGTTISVPPSTAVTDFAALTGTNAATATGTVTYDAYSDAGCTTSVNSGKTETITTPGKLPPSSALSLNPGTYYWQASYSGDSANGASKSKCGTAANGGEVETVKKNAPTLTTSFSGGGQSGVTISVSVSTAVTDTATLSGATSGAGGTVTYTAYSNSTCTTSAGSGGTVTVTGGKVPASNPVTLTTPGTYYWQASYSGDANNASSLSTCGTSGEVETVTQPKTMTSVATSLSGGGRSGTAISVPTNTAVTDAATLSGPNVATATGTVTYSVYSNSSCSVSAGSGGPVTVSGPSVPASSPVTLTTPGTYYWQASYSGDSKNLASTSTCGTAGEVETVTSTTPTSITTTLSLPGEKPCPGWWGFGSGQCDHGGGGGDQGGSGGRGGTATVAMGTRPRSRPAPPTRPRVARRAGTGAARTVAATGVMRARGAAVEVVVITPRSLSPLSVVRRSSTPPI